MQTSYTCNRSDYLIRCAVLGNADKHNERVHRQTQNEQTDPTTVTLLPSGHQTPKLKLGLITFTRLNLINCKTFIILIIRIAAMCTYPIQPVCTFFLHIPVYIIIYYVHSILSCTFYFIAHFTPYCFFLFLFYFYLYLHIFSCCVSFFCTVH